MPVFAQLAEMPFTGLAEGLLAFGEATEAFQASPGWLEGIHPALLEFSHALSQLGVLEDWAPPNPRGWRLREHFGGSDFEDVRSVLVDDGIPLAYVPRREIVHDLMQAPDRTRRVAILLDQQTKIVADCRSVLADVDEPGLKGHVRGAQDVLVAVEQGLYAPEQSHAGNLFDRLLRDIHDRDKLVPRLQRYRYARMRESLESSLSIAEDGLGNKFRTNLIVPSMARALVEFFPGDPIPEQFNRHATAHAANDPRQVNPGNALIATMLVVSVLCGIQFEGW
ncbi:hypothetical protein AB0H37_00345 [Actinomadura sp. NPDC023710]|uniref:hypothetical protein n=1 Tax=Actinomadura sp. NPDC023710 TaxID=3158219 RepID=UPI0033FDDC92